LHTNRSEGVLQGTLLGLNGIDVFPATKDPDKILKALMTYFAEGLKRPLHFFPDAAWEYAGVIAEDPTATKEATVAAMAKWDPEQQFMKTFGEGEDPYVSRVFFSADEAIDNDEFREMATSIAVGAMTGMTSVSFEKKKS
jgi:exonuclease V gamma subunit